MREGDLVISMQPEQGPLLAYHLEDLGGARPAFGSPLGAVANDRVMVGPTAASARTPPSAKTSTLVDNLPAGGRVLIVHPVTTRADDWDAPWTELVRRRSAQWGAG